MINNTNFNLDFTKHSSTILILFKYLYYKDIILKLKNNFIIIWSNLKYYGLKTVNYTYSAVLYCFALSGLFIFINFYKVYGGGDYNIIYVLIHYLKDIFYDFTQDIIIFLRNILDSLIDNKYKDISNLISSAPEGPDPLWGDPSHLHGGEGEPVGPEGSTPSTVQDNSTDTKFYKSPYFYIPVIIIISGIVIYNYESILNYIINQFGGKVIKEIDPTPPSPSTSSVTHKISVSSSASSDVTIRDNNGAGASVSAGAEVIPQSSNSGAVESASVGADVKPQTIFVIPPSPRPASPIKESSVSQYNPSGAESMTPTSSSTLTPLDIHYHSSPSPAKQLRTQRVRSGALLLHL